MSRAETEVLCDTMKNIASSIILNLKSFSVLWMKAWMIKRFTV